MDSKFFVIGLLWGSYVVESTMTLLGRCCEENTLFHNRVNHEIIRTDICHFYVFYFYEF
jgi:hypothetical protein